MQPCDAVLIPGGGVRAGGALPPWVTARFDRALEIAGASFLMPLSAGSPHRPPPLDPHGFPWTEARAGARYLVERGIDPARILIEESSFDTIGNAYFSRVIHAIPRAFARVLVVNSAFHMSRTEAIFRWVYGLDAPGVPCAVEFETVADTGLDPVTLAARMAKEQAAIASLSEWIPKIQTLSQLHYWLFTAHRQYAWLGERQPPSDAPLY